MLWGQHHGFNDPDISIMILTDGMENASSLFTGDQISNMVQRFQQQKWKFQYFGTDHDVHAMAQRISILRARSFGKNSAGFQEVSDSYVVERRNEKEAFLRAKGLWRDK
jgi:hypothetical protein